MKTIPMLLAATILACPLLKADTEPAAQVTPVRQEQAQQANIQLAILLDTSGSMQGLINQARAHIWKVVNDLTLAKQNGKLPNIEIALYEYGNNDSNSDFIRQVLPLTNDLDGISEALFGLKITGSQEFCGTVITKAVRELAWNTDDKNALKMIFIAGNEPFNQGGIEPETAIKEALAKGITVNTIYCGRDSDAASAGWKAGSIGGDGCYALIDHNNMRVDPETPYDKELIQLSSAINDTYISYGSSLDRQKNESRQVAQDAFASDLGGAVATERAVAKSKAAYNNKSWDLVDELESNKDLPLSELIATGNLSDKLKGKSEEEIKKIVREKGEERKEIQGKIEKLNKKRQEWIAQKTAQEDSPSALDKAIIKAVRKQAEDKQFHFEQK